VKNRSARRGGRSFRPIVAALAVSCALAGCATRSSGAAPAAAAVGPHDDPFEPVNRKVFAFNEFIDRILLRPLAKAYLTIVPQEARGSIHDALANAKQPIIMLNEALEGEPRRLRASFARFAVNTTIGMAGLVDVASRWHIPDETADFGQTLYRWGVASGPYLVLPVLGPSNPRDAVGIGVDSIIDPLTFLANANGLQEVEVPRLVTDGIDQRARVLPELDDLRKNSLDFYAELRSLSQQQRAAQLNPGAMPASSNFYDVSGGSAPAVAPPRPDATPPVPKNFYDIPAGSAPSPSQPVRKAAAR
jgi:phospholipid-binding lipoprotein MlaA